jgi:hypothetical protein
MEEYINENTIIKDEIYKAFKDNIYCCSCKHLMIEPVMCSECQSTFCKNCLEKSMEKRKSCPNKCENSSFIKINEKNNSITKCKFKCIKGCKKEISFHDIKEHYSSDCLSKKNKAFAMTKNQAAEYRKKSGKEIPHLQSM